MNPIGVRSARRSWRACRFGSPSIGLTVASVCLALVLQIQSSFGGGRPRPLPRATGTVQVQWNGGQGGGGMGGGHETEAMGGMGGMSGAEKYAFADFGAFGTVSGEWGVSKGQFSFLVLSGADLSVVHREVTAQVLIARVDAIRHTAQFVGLVVHDTKSSTHGGGPGGGCSDDGHDDGGCSGGGETTDDGGCTDGTHDDGGCAGGTTGTEMSMEESGHDGGCGGGCSGGEEPSEGGCGGGGGGGGGGNGPCGGMMARGASGGSSRVGQLVFAEVKDVGTPATAGDIISWRWFIAKDLNSDGQVDGIDLEILASAVMGGACWPHLCAKTVLGGNLAVHTY